METRTNLSVSGGQQGRALLMFLVVVGYILTFATARMGGAQYAISQLIFGIGFGVIYLILGLFDIEILHRFPTGAQNPVYFSIQVALVFGIGWTLGPGGNWLIGLPLAAIAVERLSSYWRWTVYAGILAAVILPIGLRYSTWQAAWMNTLIISAAIFFTAFFSQLRLNEQQAREKAEELAKRLEAANRQLAEYASQVEELAATQERNRLAREIHDNLGHYLTIINVQIGAAKMTLEVDPKHALDSLDKAQELAQRGLASVRASVSALRVSPVENRPLEDAICELVGETQTTGITARFDVLGHPRRVDEKSALALYRAAQEGLTNIRKHANASSVDVELDFSQPERIRLMVRDDGVGAADRNGGFGLIGIRERAQLLGGEFRIMTQPGKGFCLEVSVPVAEESRATLLSPARGGAR